ncbi:MAG: transcription-repair coupling factor [Lachnospiraceae bacterium]|nr:transcription-repair coupling factor [Lachnospiraceae bacterium]
MKAYLAPLAELNEFDSLRDHLKKHKGVTALTGCVEAQRAHMAFGLGQDYAHTVIVTENDMAAKAFYEDFRFFDERAVLYPAKDLLFYQADVKSNLLDRRRIRALNALVRQKRASLVLPASALMDLITTKEAFRSQSIHFACEEEMDLKAVADELARIGYTRESAVEAPGHFSVRGDILDIWSLADERPVRIEFFGDEVESIRSFDAETQRSVKLLDTIDVVPAHDHTAEETASLLDWFDKEKTLFCLVEPGRIAGAMEATEAEFSESIKNRIEQGMFDPEHTPNIRPAAEVLAALARCRCVAMSVFDVLGGAFHIEESFGTTAQAVNTYNSSFEFLIHDLEKYQKKGYRVILLSGSHSRAVRLAEDLNWNDVHAFYSEDRNRVLQPGEIMVQHGHVSRGVEYPMIRFALISESDIFGEQKKRKKKKKNKYTGDKIAGFSELSVGDYVVHENYGVGIYRGIEKVNVEGVMKDYIKLEFKGSNLYILATQLDLLQKYSGAGEGHAPRLSKIGGAEWKNTKAKVKKSVTNIAKNLVELYAARQSGQGYRFEPDTPWQREFEELFPYDETEDQLSAIEDTKRDMESGGIMDRLICGDVGYGKTEIALRAAFKAVQENKQVAVLVPTTILAQQHYKTFSQRMKDFPVRIDLLSRFRTTAQQDKTLRDLEAGKVDIVIGTHRLLSKDVIFKDLGLLVIDEEQRFGVTHKEKIKEMRKNVDVLTLTATPIPRTLHMSLIGIRDMSVLEEPPVDRVPIQTYVMEFNQEMIREAICRELARGGQVYYVYNRVKDIAEVAHRIQAMVPEAVVAYADGQMDERELENIMVDFINGDIDVLVCTTIIETGLDIPNANTMIIQDADRMGLSQLYQLRGRIGRSGRTAYAFLMYRRDKMLREEAEKRLAAIREFTELGSGIKIAMRDLEIRGAGNLLGAEQSGHMTSVGYDLYCKMLSDAVRRAKGLEEKEEFETVVDLTVNAFIPDSYITDSYQKIDAYKRIALIEDHKDYDDMADELADRFGPLPRSVVNLLNIAEIKAYAHKGCLTEIKQTDRGVILSVLPNPTFDAGELPRLLKKWNGLFTFKMMAKGPCFIYSGPVDEKNLLTNLQAFTAELAQL